MSEPRLPYCGNDAVCERDALAEEAIGYGVMAPFASRDGW